VPEDPFDRMALVEQLAAWSGGRLVAIPGAAKLMAHFGGIDAVP
jgi:hypothetical protein